MWLLSSPSMSVLLASRGCPFTSTAERVLRVEELRVLAVRTGGARDGDEDALEVAVERERDVGHHLRLDDAAGVGAVGLEERRLCDDADGLVHLAHFEFHVDADRRVDIHFDARPHDLLESLQLSVDGVGAVQQTCEQVLADLVGRRRTLDVRLRFGRGHRRARDRAAAGIGDRAEQRTGDGLRTRRTAGTENQARRRDEHGPCGNGCDDQMPGRSRRDPIAVCVGGRHSPLSLGARGPNRRLGPRCFAARASRPSLRHPHFIDEAASPAVPVPRASRWRPSAGACVPPRWNRTNTARSACGFSRTRRSGRPAPVTSVPARDSCDPRYRHRCRGVGRADRRDRSCAGAVSSLA